MRVSSRLARKRCLGYKSRSMDTNDRWSVAGRTVLITGGNSGIGRAAARALAERGAHVVLTARDAKKGEMAAQQIRQATRPDAVAWMLLDLASLESVRTFSKAFMARYDALHVLINNAGLVVGERRETRDGFEMTFGVNHLGHFELTRRLLPLLERSAPARIINVSSKAHRLSRGLPWDDLARRGAYVPFRVYADSKLANIYFTRELARRLEGKGVSAFALHPGVIATGFAMDGDVSGPLAWLFRWIRPFLLTPEKGAATTVHLATAPDLDRFSGGYFERCKPADPARVAQDDEAARRLWDVSTSLVEHASEDGAD